MNTAALMNLRAVCRKTADMDEDTTVVQLMILLQVALKEGTTGTEVAEALDLPMSSVHRSISKFSQYGNRSKPGSHLLNMEEDPENRRRKLLSLTPKGRVFFRTISDALSDKTVKGGT